MIRPPNSAVRGISAAAWLVVATALCARSASAADPNVFRPRPETDLVSFSRLLTARSPELQVAQLEVELASADVTQSHLLENPAADLSWATVPVGETNPPNLQQRYTSVPAYGLGLSWRMQLGKRGPRQDRARALEQSAKASRDATARVAALMLLRSLGSLAVSTMRVDAARGMLDNAKGSLELAKNRLDATFGTPLDVDRLQIEVSRVEQMIARSEGDVSTSLAECSAMLGMRCEGFPDRDTAKRFLEAWVDRGAGMTVGSIEQRADIRALQGYEQAADSELRLARAQAIPDPTIRVGFLHDRFTVSGNQQNSFNLTVVVPLPVFDHGQAQAQAAVARQQRYAGQRVRLLDSARARIPALRATLEIQRSRGRKIATEMLPRARAVLGDLERAASNRLVALTDVIQARRTVQELTIDEADSIGSAFEASLDLISQLPGAAETGGQGAGP
jgi:outer membrane protein, heavy metal efflux system